MIARGKMSVSEYALRRGGPFEAVGPELTVQSSNRVGLKGVTGNVNRK